MAAEFSWSIRHQFYDSSDIYLVRLERQKAEDMLNIVNDIYMGRMGDHLFSLMKSVSLLACVDARTKRYKSASVKRHGAQS